MNQPTPIPAPAPAPPPGDSNYQPPGPPPPDPRLDWLFKGLGACGLALIIGGTGWVFGGLHERIAKNEDSLHKSELREAKRDAKIEANAEANKKQWELIGNNGRGIAALKGQ